MKKTLFAIMALTCMASSLVMAWGKKEKSGKVLNIYCWNEEFQSRFNDYYASKLPSDIKVNWVITPNQDNAYQNKLDEALLGQKKAKADDKIDLFLVEADYALKYVDTKYTLNVKKDIGLTDADLAQQYKYTKDIMTDSKGNLKGVSWQACPGGFIYRRSIAKDVLGTDDPTEVGKALSNWDKFDSVAAKAKAKGYFMLSGFDDAFRVFSDNVTTAWVDKSSKIQIDPQIRRWIKQTKEYTDKGYNNKANLWSAESFAGAGKNGKVFGYFGPAWFLDFCLAPATLENPNGAKAVGNGSYGDWAFCKGPQGFSWGGTWICGAAGSDNIDLIKDIMKTLTCDPTTMVKIAKEAGDFTNNERAMTQVANSSYQNPFLGGQNHMAFFLDSAKSIDKSHMSPYDQGMNETIQHAMADYFNGKVSESTAWDNFYKSIIEKYPNLKK
ncbi:MAG: carbohydrate ABC transporter substrate-binding protein [Treponema sp.]|nr:carbohydrate ABC transporter substrate-binding protein [Treponema sp.]